MNKLTAYLKDKSNYQKVVMLAVALILLSIFGKDLPIMSQSFFGGLSAGLITTSILVNLIILGIGIALLVTGVGSVFGVILIVTSLLLFGIGGTLWYALSQIPDLFGFPVWALVMLGLVFLIIKIRNR